MSGLVLNIGANTTQAVTGIKKFGFTVEELKQQVKSLEGELSNLDRKMLSTSGGRALAGELRLAKAELKSLESQAAISGATTSNAFTKAFGSVRQLAYILPGIGIAGIFNLAFEGIGKLISGTKELSDEEKRLQDIRKESLADLGKERSQVDQLVLMLKNENTTKAEKVEILKKLKDVAPGYFSDLRTEGGLVNSLNIAYDKYLKSLVARSEVMVLSKQLDDLSGKIIDLESKGATTGIFSPELTRDLTGQLQITKRMTDEQVKQNALNIPYNQLLKERDKILQGIAQRQDAAIDNLGLPSFNAPNNKPFTPKLSGIKAAISLPFTINFKELKFVLLGGDIETLQEEAQRRINEGIEKLAKPLKLNLSPELIASNENNAAMAASAKRLTETFAETIGQGFGDAFAAVGEGIGNILSGEKFGTQIFQVLGGLIQNLGKALIQFAIIDKIIKSILANPIAIPAGIALAAGIAAIAAGALIKNLGSGRASGGAVAAGNPYPVGERGMEIFVPSTSGRIIPNNQLGGVMGQARSLVAVTVNGKISMRDIVLGVARELNYQKSNV